MNRRDFIKAGAIAGTAFATGATIVIAQGESERPKAGKFHLKYAPALGWLGDKPLDARLEFFAEQGFVAVEDNGLMGWSLSDVEGLRKKLDSLGMTFGAFVVNGDMWTKPMTTSEFHPLFLAHVRKAIEYHKCIGNKVATVITGNETEGLSREQQRNNVIEALKRAADLLEDTELTMVVEPLNVLVDHRGYFLSTSAEGAEIVQAVGHPRCRLLFDIYHQQITEGNLINNIRKYYDVIAHFHIGDVPGRKEPGTGEINYRNVFKAIYEKGYSGVLAMEHGLSAGGDEKGVLKCFEAYRKADTW